MAKTHAKKVITRSVGGTQDGDFASANDSNGQETPQEPGAVAVGINRGLTGDDCQGAIAGAGSLGMQRSLFDETPAADVAGVSFVPGDRCRSLHNQFDGVLPVYAFDGRVWLPVPGAQSIQPYPALAVERVPGTDPLPEVAVGHVVVHWADPLTYWVVCELTSTHASVWNCSTWRVFPRTELAPSGFKTGGMSAAYAKAWVRRLLLSLGEAGLLDAIRSSGIVVF